MRELIMSRTPKLCSSRKGESDRQTVLVSRQKQNRRTDAYTAKKRPSAWVHSNPLGPDAHVSLFCSRVATLPHAFLSRRLRLPILALVPLALLALPRLSSRALWATPLAAPLAAPSAASFASPSAAM
jgi:hypothetical protein